MPEMNFRRCRPDDLDQIRSFVSCMYIEDADAHAGTSGDIDLTFRELDSKPDKGQLIVIESDKVVIGYAILIFFWSNEFHGDVIDIDELFISKDHRGCGAGKAFFIWLEKTFPQCVAWSLQVSHTNPRAAKLYESLGFTTTRNRHMLKPLAAKACTVKN
jgi:GNAT superfamily N-acetyltransferase